jgi:hypothetical protein
VESVTATNRPDDWLAADGPQCAWDFDFVINPFFPSPGDFPFEPI